MANIPVFHDVGLTLLLTVLLQLIRPRRVLYQHVGVEDFCVDETSYKIAVDFSSSLYRSFAWSDGPGPHFVFADRVEVSQLQLLITNPDDFVDKRRSGAPFFRRKLLELNRIGNDISWVFAIVGDGCLNGLPIGKFPLHVVFFVEVDQINHRFRCQQQILV